MLAGEEQTTIGNHEACDLVLQDAGPGERQVRLDVTNGGVRLNVPDIGQPVFVDGREIDDAADLEPYQVVSLGMSSFAMGPAGREWPDIALPELNRIGPAAAGGEPQSDYRRISLTNGRANSADAGAAGGSGPMPAETANRNDRHSMYPAIPAGLALAAAVVLCWLLMPSDIRQSDRNAEDARERVGALASRYGAVVKVAPAPAAGGRIAVTGSIGTTRDRQRFLDELAKTGIQATVQITASEDLARIVSPILDQTLNSNRRNRVAVEALGGPPGTLLVTGYVEKEADLATAKAVLEHDIGSQARVRYDVQTLNDRVEILRQWLDGLGFEHRLQIQHVNGGIGLFGPCPGGERMMQLIGLTKRFNEEFESRPLLKLTGNGRLHGESTIELDVRAVVLGDRKRVVMRDGRSHAEGSAIGSGYRIRTIEPEFIVLEKPRRLTAEGDREPSNLAYFILED